MITGVIRYQRGTLVVQLPCKAYELAAHLGSIGIRIPASELLAHGTEQIEVNLAANESVGELILSKIRDSDTLSGVNLACQEVSRVCPFGYEEFLDMLSARPQEPYNRYAFYQSYETLSPHGGGYEIHTGGNKTIPHHHGELCPCVQSCRGRGIQPTRGRGLSTVALLDGGDHLFPVWSISSGSKIPIIKVPQARITPMYATLPPVRGLPEMRV